MNLIINLNIERAKIKNIFVSIKLELTLDSRMPVNT